MKRKSAIILSLVLALAPLAALTILSSCNTDPDKTVWEEYTDWREDNNAWLEQQQQIMQDGQPYYTTYVPNWNRASFVLLHFFNDRELTQGNYSPYSTSTVDVRYHLSLYDGTPVDSSDLNTTYGKGIFRTRLDQVIPGWTAAISQMRVGDTARIIIPYALAYGNSVSTAIPPFSNLVFDVRLVDIPYLETSPY